MKVLLLIDTLGRGGAQRQFVNLALGLHGLGHEISILTYYPSEAGFDKALAAEGIPVEIVPKKGRFDMSIVSLLRKKVNAEAYHVAISFLSTPNVYLELAAKGFSNTRVFVSERSSDLALENSFPVWVRSKLHRRADRIICNSPEYARLIRKRYPKIADRVVAIPNGLGKEFFLDRSSRKSVKDKTRIEFLAVSNIHFYKNYSNLIEAMGKLSKPVLDRFKIFWAGRIPERKDEQEKFERAKGRIEELQLTNNIEWLGEVENVRELYLNADVFIHPSKIEGMSNSICEALAAGLPLLISKVADYKWLLNDQKNGIGFDPESVSDIKTGIVKILELSEEERSQMGSQGQKFAKEKLSLEALTEAYHNIIIN